MKHFKIVLNGEEKHLYTNSIDAQREDIIDTGVTNHIHILDRSGSMYSHIDDLIEDVKKTLSMIEPNDYLTVLWFSGAGEYRTVIKNAKNSDPNINKILDTLKSTVGCTCFSDPLVELDAIVEESKVLCDTFNVTIFTDGDTVTPWSEKEEKERIFKALAVVKDKVIALNAIGYGNYYNKDLLKEMSSTTEYGVVTHAKEIEDYSKIFEHNKEVIESLRGKRFYIEAEDADIITLGVKATKLTKNKGILRLNNTKNWYAFISDSEQVLENESVAVSEYLDQQAVDLLYAYAYNLYYEGRKKDSAAVINFLGNSELLNKQTNAFTNAEQGEYQKALLELVIAGDNKFDKVLSNTLTPSRNAYCVLDLLEDLVKEEAKYIPTKNYKRVSKKVNDDFNLFEADRNEEGYPMSDIVLSQERLNISLRFRVTGHIKINPLEAKQVGLDNKIESKIYRTHTFIQDGNLNMNELQFTISEEGLNVIGPKLPANSFTISDNDVVTVDLTKLPVINASYIDDVSAENILTIEEEMLKLQAENKVLNSKLKESKEDFSDYQKQSYTEEQLEILKKHGLAADGTYRPIATSATESTDIMIVKEFKTYIKGASSIPALTKVTEKLTANKTLNLVESLLNNSMVFVDGKDEQALSQKLAANKKELNKIRFKLSGYKIALVLTNEWLPDADKNEDGSYSFTKDDKTLVIKLERKEINI